eukprot:TRINITY_DN5340_c0_g1_i1.p1 TRINITY_DN5340_c0_g1~~TRINITY_DN5340_c0_g1_i1.p1  ORF type:complete len:415 (-),score=77.52 TRINITY_DN5340_c0_g1_i1:43-1287(-)
MRRSVPSKSVGIFVTNRRRSAHGSTNKIASTVLANWPCVCVVMIILLLLVIAMTTFSIANDDVKDYAPLKKMHKSSSLLLSSDDVHEFSSEICSASKTLCNALKWSPPSSLSAAETSQFIPGSTIPTWIHQTWNDSSDWRVSYSFDSFKTLNPNYRYLLWSDRDVDAFFKYVFPEVHELSLKLHPSILKYDLFRYLVVLKFGGVYSDVDIKCLKPIDTWITNSLSITSIGRRQVELLVGIEIDFIAREEQDPGHKLSDFQWVHPLQFCQWTFAGSRGNSVLRDVAIEVIDRLTKFVSLEREAQQAKVTTATFIMNLTGPGVFSTVIHEHLDARAHKKDYWKSALTKLKTGGVTVGEIGVLSITAFSPGLQWPDMNSGSTSDSRALVEHFHAGFWHGEMFSFIKKKQDRRTSGIF